MILFIGCLLLVIVQVVWLYVLTYSLMPLNPDLPPSFSSTKPFIISLILLVLAIFGSLSSFYAHYPNIKAVSIN